MSGVVELSDSYSTMTDKKLKAQWTQEHDSFCLENKICPSAKLLWQWLMNRGELGEESEPDLAEFNDWVSRHRGKPYSRPTLKTALAQLVDCGVVRVVKKYTWKLVKIITRPLDWLKPTKNLRKRDKTFTSDPSNPLTTDERLSSSSIPSNSPPNKDEVLEICAEAGIFYDADKPAEIFRYSIDDIRLAIEHFKARGGHAKIHNPEGWLIECLRWRYWEKLTGTLVSSLLGLFGI
jgi:hypothetical protein